MCLAVFDIVLNLHVSLANQRVFVCTRVPALDLREALKVMDLAVEVLVPHRRQPCAVMRLGSVFSAITHKYDVGVLLADELDTPSKLGVLPEDCPVVVHLVYHSIIIPKKH